MISFAEFLIDNEFNYLNEGIDPINFKVSGSSFIHRKSFGNKQLDIDIQRTKGDDHIRHVVNFSVNGSQERSNMAHKSDPLILRHVTRAVHQYVKSHVQSTPGRHEIEMEAYDENSASRSKKSKFYSAFTRTMAKSFGGHHETDGNYHILHLKVKK